jgi:hypothetical protein
MKLTYRPLKYSSIPILNIYIISRTTENYFFVIFSWLFMMMQRLERLEN